MNSCVSLYRSNEICVSCGYVEILAKNDIKPTKYAWALKVIRMKVVFVVFGWILIWATLWYKMFMTKLNGFESIQINQIQ